MGGSTSLTLPQQFTVDNIMAIKELLSSKLYESGSELECYGEDVQVIDTAGLQVLLAFYKTAVKEGKQISVLNPSSYLQGVFAFSGVDKVITVKEVCKDGLCNGS